jgi:hypothetical protein
VILAIQCNKKDANASLSKKDLGNWKLKNEKFQLMKQNFFGKG